MTVDGVSALTDPSAEPPARGPRFRPVVVLNALAAAALAVSILMFQADPMPTRVGTSLPTFLGTRALDQDVRAKIDLREAITAMDGYRADHGTYTGFDAAA